MEDATAAPLPAATRQLGEYFSAERREFDLPLCLHGTEFQRRVWNVLTRIPYGETWSYVQLARRVGNPNASRAVGLANGRNPVSILVPCHRVVGKRGALGGYAGGLEAKRRLLALEGSEASFSYPPDEGSGSTPPKPPRTLRRKPTISSAR